MKTAIDIVIETLTALKDEAFNEAKSSRLNNKENAISDAIYTAYSIAIKEASKLKETEKQQIIDAVDKTMWDWKIYLREGKDLTIDNGEHYYKDKFVNNI